MTEVTSRPATRRAPVGGYRRSPAPGSGRRPAGRGAPAELGRPVLRLRVGLLAILVMLSLVAGRLVWLQGFQAKAYAADAVAQRLSTVTLQAPRGQITDRNGQVLAMSVDARLIYGEPRTIAKASCRPPKPCTPAAIAAVLAPTVGLPVADLTQRLSLTPAMPGKACTPEDTTGCRGYVVLAHGYTPERADRIRALNLVGIGSAPEPKRLFPANDVGANLIGFTTNEGVGAAGIEQQYNAVLAGHDGKLTAEIDGGGRIIPNGRSSTVAPRPGRGVQLTIDRDLQYAAQQALAAQVQASGAESGSATVMDVRTGQVLALASVPSFDANDPGSSPATARGNLVITAPYEPGSIGKAMTAAAALEEGVETPQSVITVPPSIRVGGYTFHDAEVHGTEQLTFTGVLVQSSNIGTILAAQKVGAPRLYDMLRRFGIGAPTGIQLPAETSGQLRDQKTWSASDMGTHPIGQGYSVSGLQMASVYATIANGGVREQPTIVSEVADDSGALQPAPQAPPRRVIGADVAAQLRGMLEGVTGKGGTAPAAAIEGYRVAGKTGTADRVVDGHYNGKTASFVGFAPADAPRLVVQVSIQGPTKGYFGGLVAAPVFQQIMRFALSNQDLPPTGAVSPVLKLKAD